MILKPIDRFLNLFSKYKAAVEAHTQSFKTKIMFIKSGISAFSKNITKKENGDAKKKKNTPKKFIPPEF